MSTDKLKGILDSKTYVVGVGVQKAGTTWLHDYLARQPDIFMPRRKELHFFDRERPVRLKSMAELKRLYELARRGKRSFEPERLNEAFDFNPSFESDVRYLDFFRGVGAQRLFGEVTPAYALIGNQGYRRMKALFSKLKVIYLMRDPVDRHHSMLRMGDSTGKDRAWMEQRFMRKLGRGIGLKMSNYPSHIEALRSVFSPHELYIGFYETLFTDGEIRRLCDFLEIPFAAADFGTRKNASPTDSSIDPELITQAREALAPVYDYCVKNFPDLPASWRV